MLACAGKRSISTATLSVYRASEPRTASRTKCRWRPQCVRCCNRGRGDGGFAGWTKLKNKLDAKFAAAGSLPPWRLHDLRRSVATELANLGIQPHIIEAVLNHVGASKSGVAGIYNGAIGQFGFATWSSVGARQFER